MRYERWVTPRATRCVATAPPRLLVIAHFLPLACPLAARSGPAARHGVRIAGDTPIRYTVRHPSLLPHVALRRGTAVRPIVAPGTRSAPPPHKGAPMGQLDGKTALIFGVANHNSVAWAIAQKL